MTSQTSMLRSADTCSLRWRTSLFIAPILLVMLGACTYHLDSVAGVQPLTSVPIMSYGEYTALEHDEPYILTLGGEGGSLLYFGSRHTTDPMDAQVDSMAVLWAKFRPTVALAESRKGRRGSMDAGIKTFGESAVPVSLANADDIPVYTFEPPLETEIGSLLPTWSSERLLLFYVLRSYTARALSRRSDGQMRELLRERGEWPGLEGAISTLVSLDSLWQAEFPEGPEWRQLPWQATWPTGSETWLNEISASVNRVRDQYMIALIVDLVARGERVFAVAGSSHVVMQEAALRTLIGSQATASSGTRNSPQAPVVEAFRSHP
jgi:hypothetical protein